MGDITKGVILIGLILLVLPALFMVSIALGIELIALLHLPMSIK